MRKQGKLETGMGGNSSNQNANQGTKKKQHEEKCGRLSKLATTLRTYNPHILAHITLGRKKDPYINERNPIPPKNMKDP